MKDLLSILLLLSLGCNNQARQINNVPAKDSAEKFISKTDNSKYYTTKDSIQISFDDDTMTYKKATFNQLIDEHPEFFTDVPNDPDLLYYSVGDGRKFGSELGQDEYYLLYAYFLRLKSSSEKYKDIRNNITAIYSNINSLFTFIEHGGPHFWHQHARIPAYTELAVYQYSNKADLFSKTYSITKQKELYIRSLRQLIADESNIDSETTGDEKPGKTREMNKTVDSLDKLISNYFYLRKAQEFQYSYYQYF